MSLFELRGELDKRTKLILEIAGIALILLIWFVLAFFLSEERISVLDDDEIVVEIVDDTYTESDSMLVEHMDQLMIEESETLAAYGLKKERIYPILPSPVHVIKSFKELHFEDYLVVNTGKSIWLNFLGYLLAIAVSIPIGFALGLIPFFRGLFNRTFDAFRFIPLTAVTGIFIMWFGFDNQMKVAFLAFGIIVYLVPVVVQRIDEVQSVYLRTVFTLGANSWQTIKTVYWPSVLSRLFDDIRVLTAISWTYITIAELLNKSGGIGELIWLARRQSRMDKAFAVLVIIVLIGIFQDKLFFWLDKKLFPHKHMNKGKKH
ncbi:MAG: ABC transporter permease subunit [Bacteroidota bacterium]